MAEKTALWVTQADSSGAKKQAELLSERIDGWEITTLVADPVDLDLDKPVVEEKGHLRLTAPLHHAVRWLDVDLVVYHHFNEHIAETLGEVKQHAAVVSRWGINLVECSMLNIQFAQAVPEIIAWTRSMDHIIAPSNRTALRLGALGVGLEQITVIPTALEFKNVQPPTSAPPQRIGHLAARINPLKNQHLTVKVTSALNQKERWADAEAHLTGERTEYADTLEQTADALGIEDQVKFRGYVTQPDRDFWPEMGVAVLPSWSENGPMVIREAARAGVPVIAADSSWASEYRTLEVAQPDNPMDWAAAVDALLTDTQHRRYVVERQQTEMRNRFEMKDVVGQYAQLFSGILAENDDEE